MIPVKTGIDITTVHLDTITRSTTMTTGTGPNAGDDQKMMKTSMGAGISTDIRIEMEEATKVEGNLAEGRPSRRRRDLT